ncbi:MAG: hypothetical protein HWD85_11120 [Flavobacteriaceae bacterium]|nr:hypothetical protein [Flavobacteriaceae bacterium]
MKKLILLIAYLIANTMLSQSKGDDFRKKGDLMNAIKTYKAVYKKDKFNSKNTYNLACAYALTYQKDSAFYYLNISLKDDTRLWALADNDLYPLSKDKRWTAIENKQLAKYQAKNGAIKNPTYAKQLLQIIMKDQAMNYQQDMARRYYMKYGHVPHWFYPILELKKEIGGTNFTDIQYLIKQYGWPTYSMVGTLAADAPLLVINHLEGEEMRIKYLPEIKKACLQKEGSCMEYAKIQDRILVNTNQKQIYGMQFRYTKDRKLEPFPIKNPKYVDQKRKAIGLEPIKQYLKRKINYDWTIKQKTKS